jgi:hypothetical protein
LFWEREGRGEKRRARERREEDRGGRDRPRRGLWGDVSEDHGKQVEKERMEGLEGQWKARDKR